MKKRARAWCSRAGNGTPRYAGLVDLIGLQLGRGNSFANFDFEPSWCFAGTRFQVRGLTKRRPGNSVFPFVELNLRLGGSRAASESATVDLGGPPCLMASPIWRFVSRIGEIGIEPERFLEVCDTHLSRRLRVEKR